MLCLLVWLYSSFSYYPCWCFVFLFSFTFLYLITPAAALSSCSLYSSFSYYPCCSVFLFPLLFFILFPLLLHCLLVPFTLLSFCIPCCSALFPFTFLTLNIQCCCFVLYHFTLLFLILYLVPLYSSFSYYPCCCSVFLFPLLFFVL